MLGTGDADTHSVGLLARAFGNVGGGIVAGLPLLRDHLLLVLGAAICAAAHVANPTRVAAAAHTFAGERSQVFLMPPYRRP